MARTFTAITGGGAGGAYQASDRPGYQTLEKIRQNMDVFAELGSDKQLQFGIAGVNAAAYVEVPFPFLVNLNKDDFAGMTVQLVISVRTTNAATSVRLKLRNETTAADVLETDEETSTSWVHDVYTLTLTAGANDYKLYIKGSNATHAILGAAYIRIRKT